MDHYRYLYLAKIVLDEELTCEDEEDLQISQEILDEFGRERLEVLVHVVEERFERVVAFDERAVRRTDVEFLLQSLRVLVDYSCGDH